jgi:hypothetical protein
MTEMYSSKYSLAAGEIEVVDVEIREPYAYRLKGWQGFKIGRDIHDTKDKAIASAEAMRTKKIASLKKQIVRLEKLVFKPINTRTPA